MNNPFDLFMPSTTIVEAELQQTKNKLKLLEDKFALLEAKMNCNSFSIIPFVNVYGAQIQFIDINCEEITIHNTGAHSSGFGSSGWGGTTPMLYFDKILFGELHHFINFQVENELLEPRKITNQNIINQIRGQNSVKFLEQFKNIKHLVIDINYDVQNQTMTDILKYTIETIMNVYNFDTITINGKNVPDFHTWFLKLLQSNTNYKTIEFDVDQTKMDQYGKPNGDYCDKWKTLLKQPHSPIKKLRLHCEATRIEFINNII